MTRRVVHKITPSRQSSFDQQFWPVLVALTVLCGIALGAILTILNGPWMWVSLLLLPILSATAIFLLFNLDNVTLKRSLQFAIILSLALHLFILVFASAVNIFQNPFKPVERQVAQRKIRTIEISDQRAAFVWEETNANETPEPKVETERQTQPTTNVRPQPIPVPETKPEVNPQLTKREKSAESVPRQNRELSKLARQTKDLQPQSSQQNTGEKHSLSKTAATSAKANESLKSSNRADSTTRQSTPVAQSQPEPAKPAAAPESSTPQKVVRTSSSPRRADPTKPVSQSAPQASASTARIRRSTPNIPIASKQAPTVDRLASATTKTPTASEPAKSAEQTTRRPERSRTVSPTLANQPRTELSPRSQVAQSAQRRSSNQVQPSISSESSVALTPRRSTRDSQVAASPMTFEKPSRAPESNKKSSELNSKTLSVSRSNEGVAGVGRSNNLDRFVGGMTSPASRASDSARRERTQSKPNEAQMLTSSQKSDVRRAIGADSRPTSAFQAETSSPAKIAGSRNTSQRSMESSAAKVESASTNHRDEISAEKGDATVDLGPTKVVMDRESSRRSGGGQPEVSQLNPESTRPSKDRSQQQPSLAAATGLDVVAPRNPSAASPSNEALEASEQSIVATKSGGQNAITAQRNTAEIAGEMSDQGESNLVQALADSRARASRNQDESSWDVQQDDEEGENPGGTKRPRIAQAPVVRSAPGTGLAKSDGRATTQADERGDSPSESLASKVSRQSNAAMPGSGIGRSAAQALIQAATSLPIIETPKNRRTGASNSNNNVPEMSSGLAQSTTPRTRASATPNVTSSSSGEFESSLSKKSKGTGASENLELDSTSVTVSRTDLAAMEQIQGSKLDVIADEGPAGLGMRPDERIGVINRPSSRDSEQLQPNLNSRFRNPRFGGTPAVNPDAVIARDAFRNRNPSSMSSAAEPTTEAAIHLGLEFLARHQSPDGSWSLTGFDREAPQHRGQLDSDTAATGLALLAFQGAGYNHREFKYARQIDHAIQWLIENQSDDGGLYVPTDKRSNGACRLYSHGIAALALTEAYGMTQDLRLKEPAQKALDYIASSQDPRKGGWRYFDEPGKKSSDTSVSGWMMMALQSGRLAGLNVEPQTFDSVEDWLDVAADPENPAVYRYNPYAEDSKGVSRERQGRMPTPSMTSVGLLMRIYSGWDRDDPRLLAGADFLLQQQLPSDSAPLLRDTYYWYYATQVLKHIDGPRWKTWNDALRPLLTRSQVKTDDMAGSWHPYKPVPDRWGQFGGRIYVTTMNLLSLEVRHRMLPLYNQGKPPKKVGALDAIMPREVSFNRLPERKPVSIPESNLRKPSVQEKLVKRPSNGLPAVGPGTTRTQKPLARRRPLTLGLNNPNPTQTNQPNDPESSWPTIVAATRPGSGIEESLENVSPTTRLTERPTAKTETISPPRKYSQVESDVLLDATKSTAQAFEIPTKRSIGVTPATLNLSQAVALKFDPRVRQTNIPKLTPTAAKTASVQPMVPNSFWPTIDAAAQPELERTSDDADIASRVAGRSAQSERTIERERLAEINTALPPTKVSQPGLTDIQLDRNHALGQTFARSIKRPMDASQPTTDPPQIVAIQSDPRRRSLRIPILTEGVTTNMPGVPDLTNLPTLDAPAQPTVSDLQLVETDITAAFTVRKMVQPNVVSKANLYTRTDVAKRPFGPNKSLVSAKDRPIKIDPIDPNRSGFESAPPLAFDTGTTRNRLGNPQPAASIGTDPSLAIDQGNQLAIKSQFQSASQISASPRAESVAKRTARGSAYDSQNNNLPRIDFSGPEPGSRTPIRSRIKRVLSNLANTVANRPQPQRSGPNGSVIVANRWRPWKLRRSAPVLSATEALQMANPQPAPPMPASQFASASGIATLDGEVLKAAKIELIPIDVEDGKRVSVQTDTSGQFRFATVGGSKQPGVKVGKYKVSITTFVESSDENLIDFLELVPAKYNTETTLVISITSDGPNEFDLKLISD